MEAQGIVLVSLIYFISFQKNIITMRIIFCYIGIRYAMMAMKVLIANVLKEYVVKKEKLIKITDVKLKADIILKPFEPIKIKIEKRSL